MSSPPPRILKKRTTLPNLKAAFETPPAPQQPSSLSKRKSLLFWRNNDNLSTSTLRTDEVESSSRSTDDTELRRIDTADYGGISSTTPRPFQSLRNKASRVWSSLIGKIKPSSSHPIMRGNASEMLVPSIVVSNGSFVMVGCEDISVEAVVCEDIGVVEDEMKKTVDETIEETVVCKWRDDENLEILLWEKSQMSLPLFINTVGIDLNEVAVDEGISNVFFFEKDARIRERVLIKEKGCCVDDITSTTNREKSTKKGLFPTKNLTKSGSVDFGTLQKHNDGDDDNDGPMIDLSKIYPLTKENDESFPMLVKVSHPIKFTKLETSRNVFFY